MTVFVELTRGYRAVIDEVDAPRVLIHKWRAVVRRDTVYAARTLPWTEDGKRPCELLHRLILNAAPGRHVDHADGDGLNNTRANLRECSPTENGRNSKTRRDNRYGLKGVSFNPRIRRYTAAIYTGEKPLYLGSFRTTEEAHAAYRSAAAKFFGQFARP